MAYDLTVIDVTKDHIEVSGATINHHAWPQGISTEWNTASSGQPATGLMSDWLEQGKLKEAIQSPT